MNLRENAMAIYRGEQPDLYFDFMDALSICPDPLMMRDMPQPDGQEFKDSFGTTLVWPPGAPGSHPHITEENKVVKDITKWRDYVVFPPVEGLDWSIAKQVAEGTNREERFVAYFCPCGLFERSHFLMGMEDALVNYMVEQDAMYDLLTAIKDYKIACIREAAKQIEPEVIFYHDDWGHKYDVFLPPEVWRKMIKPLQQEISDVIHECGMIYIHHSDSYCAPLVEDMVDLGVDIWQGVIAQNPITEIQKVVDGRMALIGGIDGPALDVEGLDEEFIRKTVRDTFDKILPAGRMFPGIPNGQCFIPRNDAIVKDEAIKYGRQWAVEHPVGPVDENWSDEEIRNALM